MTEYSTRPKPCESCPYKKSTPLGVWAKEEYEKLLTYDGDIAEQIIKGGSAVFLCHHNEGNEEKPCLCRGWTDTHKARNLAAIRLSTLCHGSKFPEDVFDDSGVEVYASGQEAHDANLEAVENPKKNAKKVMSYLLKKNNRLKEK